MGTTMAGEQLELWEREGQEENPFDQASTAYFGQCHLEFDKDAYSQSVNSALGIVAASSQYVNAEEQQQLYAAVVGSAISGLIFYRLNNLVHDLCVPHFPHH